MEAYTKVASKGVTERLPISGLIAGREVSAHFQPIVHLESGAIVGYEALARGPLGTSLETPAALFAAARSEGNARTLDRICREVALEDALAAGLDQEGFIFLNAEPSTLDVGGPISRFAERALERLSVVVELTERMLTTRPAEVLSAVAWLRERGCRIALDDVGIDPRSLALMPFVSPDLIKLDMRIVQDRLDPMVTARTLNAIGAEIERSGAVLVAEGIETPAHLERARSLGAVLGQGWLFGHPKPLATPPPWRRAVEIPQTSPASTNDLTPFRRLAVRHEPRRGAHSLVVSLSHQLEDEVAALRGEAVLVANFQDHRELTRATLARYEKLAESAALVAALGPGMGRSPGVGVRGADIPLDDELHSEWNVTVVGPHFAAAFAAREVSADRHLPDRERRFDYVVSYERDAVIESASVLLRHVLRSA